MAIPIKDNILDSLEDDGSITLNTEEDIDMFLYRIQARNRMNEIVNFTQFQRDLSLAHTDEEKFRIFQKYEDSDKKDTRTRWTSINFNHMQWNTESPGRIEVRIFNSSLEPEIIFQDLLLIAKLFEVSLKNAKNPDYKKEEFNKLMSRDVTETTKVNNLLNLLFEDTNTKRIFKNRWKSVKNKREYQRFKSSRETFIR